MVRTAEIIFREQFLHEQIAAQAEWRRAKHRDQFRKSFRRGQHFLRFRAIVRHSGLAENMFAGFEGGNRYGRMHVGRRPDPDDIQLRDREEIGPVRHRRGVWCVFLAKFLRAFVGGIGDGYDLHFRMFLQSRQMPIPYDRAGADDADPQFVIVGPAHLKI